MKKLNNRGWGLGEFIIIICALLSVLIIIAVVAKRNGMDSGSDKYKYKPTIVTNSSTPDYTDEYNRPSSTNDYYEPIVTNNYNNETNRNIENIKNTIKDATYNYVTTYYEVVYDPFIVPLTRLETDGYLEHQNYGNNSCQGYVIVKSIEKDSYLVYLDCRSYKTVGYDENLAK